MTEAWFRAESSILSRRKHAAPNPSTSQCTTYLELQNKAWVGAALNSGPRSRVPASTQRRNWRALTQGGRALRLEAVRPIYLAPSMLKLYCCAVPPPVVLAAHVRCLLQVSKSAANLFAGVAAVLSEEQAG